MAKKTSYKDKELGDLKKALADKREDLRQIRFAATGAKTKDAYAATKARKDIARILTEITLKSKAV